MIFTMCMDNGEIVTTSSGRTTYSVRLIVNNVNCKKIKMYCFISTPQTPKVIFFFL